MGRSGKWVFMLGCLLVMGSFGLLLTTQIQVKQAQMTNTAVVETINALLPEGRLGIMDSYSDMSMPVLEISGVDYTALVDIPALGLTLPVADGWERSKVTVCPRRFSGTVYDGSLIIGGADQPGQFSGFTYLPIGSTVTITDMTGAVFSYVVADIQHTNSASAEVLMDGAADLTLFVRNARGLDYILLRCVVN